MRWGHFPNVAPANLRHGVYAQALSPLVEGIIGKDMVRFKEYALQLHGSTVQAAAKKA